MAGVGVPFVVSGVATVSSDPRERALFTMEHWRDVLPSTIHHVDYEEMVVDLEAVARRLVVACGLEWDPACLEFYRNERPVRTASVIQVRQPVYKKSVARWRNYEHDLAELFGAIGNDTVVGGPADEAG